MSKKSKEELKLKVQVEAFTAIRFLKKIVLFCIGYIVLFSITMIIVFLIRGETPEILIEETFKYFSIEIILSSGIKIAENFLTKNKKKQTEYEMYNDQTDSTRTMNRTEETTYEDPIQPGEIEQPKDDENHV